MKRVLTSLALSTVLLLGGFGGRLLAVEISGIPRVALENGDVNGDSRRDVTDGVNLMTFLFLGGEAPVPLALCGDAEPAVENGDTNGDTLIDVSDPIQLFSWLFLGLPAPVEPCGEGFGAHFGRRVRIVPRIGFLRRVYSHLQEEWWKWAVAIPAGPDHPLFDETGENCDADQSGLVWNLGGTFSVVEEGDVIVGRAERSCTVPRHRFVFFPILNVLSSTAELGDVTDEELQADAAFFAAAATDVSANINGREVRRIDRFQGASGLFDFDVPDGNIIGAEAGTYRGADEGHYLLLAPLPRGTHDINFAGAFIFTVEEHGFELIFQLDITYHLTVE